MKLDLNFPDFQADLFSLEKADTLALIRSLKKIARLTHSQIRSSSGLNLEKISTIRIHSNIPIYSIGITKKSRATVIIEGDYLRFIALHPDHDSTYD